MRWVRILAGCLIALVLVLRARTCSKEYVQSSPPERGSVRDELSKLQQRTGLTLAAFDISSILFVKFARRGIEWQGDFENPVGVASWAMPSPDGRLVAVAFPSGPHFDDSDLGIIQLDSAPFRRYPGLGWTNDICWSSDTSQLALAEVFPVKPEVKWPAKRGRLVLRPIQILNRSSGTLQKAFDGSYLTSQCWSPDGSQIVYQADEGLQGKPDEPGSTIKIYDVVQKKSRTLTKGSMPSWSPDGQWIAFFSDGAYREINPSGEGRKALFNLENPVTGLWWSPDSRIVAYLRSVSLSESNRSTLAYLDFPPEYRLQVRRLTDNSEDWVAQLAVSWMLTEYWAPLSFQWTTGISSEQLAGSARDH